jgi:hypothetical protein
MLVCEAQVTIVTCPTFHLLIVTDSSYSRSHRFGSCGPKITKR